MTDPSAVVRAAIEANRQVQARLAEESVETIVRMGSLLIDVLRRGGTIYLCGNGGSAADAQHLAGELVGRFILERRPLPAVALASNPAVVTAIGNDYDFNSVFARQVRAHLRPGDALIGISTSGRSTNVLTALQAAAEIGAHRIGWTGTPGEPIASACEICLRIPSQATPRIQEGYLLAGHALCDLIDRAVAGESEKGA